MRDSGGHDDTEDHPAVGQRPIDVDAAGLGRHTQLQPSPGIASIAPLAVVLSIEPHRAAGLRPGPGEPVPSSGLLDESHVEIGPIGDHQSAGDKLGQPLVDFRPGRRGGHVRICDAMDR